MSHQINYKELEPYEFKSQVAASSFDHKKLWAIVKENSVTYIVEHNGKDLEPKPTLRQAIDQYNEI